MSEYLLQDWLRKEPWWLQIGDSVDARCWHDWNWWVAPLSADRRGVSALCRDWVARRKDPASPICTRRDDIVDYCQAAANLQTAVNRACDSFRPDGRLHNHASRVPLSVREEYARRLRGRLRGTQLSHWDELWHVCETVGLSTPGIGPVMYYDVATRIGAYLGLSPYAIFAKAGTLDGSLALSKLDDRRHPIHQCEWMPLSWYARRGFKPVIEYGGADSVEDALCTLRAAIDALAARREVPHVWARDAGPHQRAFAAAYKPPYICAACGVRIVLLRGKEVRSLCVHHVDEDRSNNDPANLVPMHKACHDSHHNSGRTITPEWRSRISAAKRGRKQSSAHIAALSAVRKGVKRGPPSKATRAKISAGVKAAHLHRVDPTLRQRRSGR